MVATNTALVSLKITKETPRGTSWRHSLWPWQSCTFSCTNVPSTFHHCLFVNLMKVSPGRTMCISSIIVEMRSDFSAFVAAFEYGFWKWRTSNLRYEVPVEVAHTFPCPQSTLWCIFGVWSYPSGSFQCRCDWGYPTTTLSPTKQVSLFTIVSSDRRNKTALYWHKYGGISRVGCVAIILVSLNKKASMMILCFVYYKPESIFIFVMTLAGPITEGLIVFTWDDGVSTQCGIRIERVIVPSWVRNNPKPCMVQPAKDSTRSTVLRTGTGTVRLPVQKY